MKERLFNKIKHKLLAMIMAGALLGMLFLTLVFVIHTVSLLEKKRNHQISTELGILATNIAASVMFQDETAARELLRGMVADRDIFFVEIDTPGKDFDVRESLHDNVSESGNLSNRYELFIYPISVDGEQIGILKAYADDSSLDQQISFTITTSLFIFIFIAALIYLLSFKLQAIITSPIAELIGLSKKVTEDGDYSLRAPDLGSDEIGMLADDFNRMLEQIEQRDLMLEKTVQQRTAELEKLADEFRHRAFHDVLTGLPNRALLSERFHSVVSHSKRTQEPFGLFLLDLDNFKNINDTLGHELGDEVLKTTASRLLSCLRDEDLVCRLGGDEFLIIAESFNEPDSAHRVSEKLLTSLSESMIVNGKRLDVKMSIGCAVFPMHGDNLTALKRAADIAMYAAKESGKNQYKIFHTDMEATSKHRLMVQNDLRSAIKQGEIQLYYQPQVNVRSHEVYGCEVLVRWRHPKHGLLAPDLFIPHAEESGLVPLIDYYVIEGACRQAKEWLDEGLDLVVSVNLSGLHFRDRKVVDALRRALDITGLPPNYLGVELTEAVLISDSELAIQVVGEIKDLGIKISLDDFGVGYSSLNYLRTLPFDVVKLDKSFISGILTSPQDQRLTEGIMNLAASLQLDVVAEGVESSEQADYLQGINCYLLQGYFFLPPRPKAEFESWLASWQPPSTPKRNLIFPFGRGESI
ncbi:putative bifunctional diguanylate cyclase/phosphodiesterase [Simiduia aestuariiviva]|uniref:Diguanylate cyclase (GGDEF)-like protein n=1 Tax=Simiduia aestuariiviva TaxID=1510459 RepID=A0A839UWS9_9GAMM|nr:EAL domain-containing protein [Simiduia aestuariiviva]MBB3169785.1 diguanylate cyclase (GGDEF)-like protein [Simiduia aestuariiviva]